MFDMVSSSGGAHVRFDGLVKLFAAASPPRSEGELHQLFSNALQSQSSSSPSSVNPPSSPSEVGLTLPTFERMVQHLLHDGCSFALLPMPIELHDAVRTLLAVASNQHLDM